MSSSRGRAIRSRGGTRLGAEAPRPEATPFDGPDPYGNPDPEPEWLRIDWRDHLRTVEVEGSAVNHVDLGSGEEPPLLFVHGLGGSWQNFLENLPHFAHSRRAVALDLPGFAASPMPDWEVSIPAYGRFLRGFCRRLGLVPCAIVGNSMGGLIAAEAAIGDHELAAGLVLVSSVGISNARLRREPAEAMARAFAAMAPVAFQLREASMRRPALRSAAFSQIFSHPDALRAELLWEQYRGALGPDGDMIAPGFVPALAALAGYDFRDRLPSIAAATLIVWGRNDLVVPPQDAADFERLIAGSRVEIFADCGHAPQLERPTRFNALLDAFLAEHVPGARARSVVAPDPDNRADPG